MHGCAPSSAPQNCRYLDPLFFGDWPPERLLADSQEGLPRFSRAEQALLRAGRPDYIGREPVPSLNYVMSHNRELGSA